MLERHDFIERVITALEKSHSANRHARLQICSPNGCRDDGHEVVSWGCLRYQWYQLLGRF